MRRRRAALAASAALLACGLLLGAAQARAAVAAGSAAAVAVPSNAVVKAGADAELASSLSFSFTRKASDGSGANSGKGAFRSNLTGWAQTRTTGGPGGTISYRTAYRKERGDLVVYALGAQPGIGAPQGVWGRVNLTTVQTAKPSADLSVLYGTPDFPLSEIALLRYARITKGPTKTTVGGVALKAYSVVIDPLGSGAPKALRQSLLEAWGATTIKAEVLLDGAGRLRRIEEGVTRVVAGKVFRIVTRLDLSGHGAPVKVAFPAKKDVKEVTATVVKAVTGADRTADVLPQLRAVALAARQAGPGYVVAERPDGLGVLGTVTLDACNKTFASEALRIARLQVNYALAGEEPVMSNEVVVYQKGGAAKAMAEERKVGSRCTAKTATGGTRVERAIAPKGLPAGAFAVLLQLKERTGTVQIVGVYQVRGDVLTGVYVRVKETLPKTTALAVYVAEQSAANLRRSGAVLQRLAQK